MAKDIMILGKGPTCGRGLVIAKRLIEKDGPESLDIWGLNEMRLPIMDALFEMHPWPAVREFNDVTDCLCPVYMLEKYPGVPQAREYPLREIAGLFPTYFANTVAYMVALALYRALYYPPGPKRPTPTRRPHPAVRRLYVYGVDYHPAAYGGQELIYERPCTECWLFLAISCGLAVQFPKTPPCTLFTIRKGFVRGTYGYRQRDLDRLFGAGCGAEGTGAPRNDAEAPFGYCPICGRPGSRRDAAGDHCEAGHNYPSLDAIYGAVLAQEPDAPPAGTTDAGAEKKAPGGGAE